MVQVQKEFKGSWRILVAAILQYVAGYPGTLLPMSNILLGPKYDLFKTSETEKAVTIGLFTVFMNLVSISVEPMVKARSSRFVALLGTSCQVIGLVVCAFSDSSALIMIGFGMLTGTGVGLSFVNNIIIVQKHFSNNTSLAFGTALTFICLAGLGIPQVVNYLIGEFEQQGDLVNKWTILVYAGFSCVGFLGAFLMAPNPGILVPCTEESVPEEVEDQAEESELIQAFREFNILLQDPKYVVTAIVNSCCFSIMVYFISLITPIAKARELEDQSFVLVTIFSASNAVAMLPMGLLGDSSFLSRIFKFPKKTLYIFCCFGLNLTIVFISLTSNFIALIIGTVLASIFTSGMFITTNLVYLDCFKSRFGKAVGLSNLFRCIFALSVTYSAGQISSLTGCQDLHCSLHFLSGTSFILLLIWLVLGLKGWG